MKVTIEINCDNAAFGESQEEARVEIRRILEEQAEKVRFYPLDGLSDPFDIRDYNGNKVGFFSVERV